MNALTLALLGLGLLFVYVGAIKGDNPFRYLMELVGQTPQKEKK